MFKFLGNVYQYSSVCGFLDALMSLPRRLIGSFKPSQNVSFKPPSSWRDVVLDHGLVDMMFRVSQSAFSILFSFHLQDVTLKRLQCVLVETTILRNEIHN